MERDAFEEHLPQPSSDDEQEFYCGVPPRDERMDEETWQAYFQEHLLDAYDAITRAAREAGWPIFDKLTYPKFAEFAWSQSSGYPSVL